MSHHTAAAALPKAYAKSEEVSRKQAIAGRIITGLGVVFMIFDGVIKFFPIEPVVQAMQQLGWPVEVAPVLGAIALACVAVYLVPRTAVLGAVLLTGYLGGAIATHLRVGSSLFGSVLFPVYIAALFWVGLYLRDARVRATLRAQQDR